MMERLYCQDDSGTRGILARSTQMASSVNCISVNPSTTALGTLGSAPDEAATQPHSARLPCCRQPGAHLFSAKRVRKFDIDIQCIERAKLDSCMDKITRSFDLWMFSESITLMYLPYSPGCAARYGSSSTE